MKFVHPIIMKYISDLLHYYFEYLSVKLHLNGMKLMS